MKTLRTFGMGFIGLVTFAIFAFLGTLIGFSRGQALAALGTALVGFYIGSLVGVIAAIVVMKSFAKDALVREKKTGDSPTSEIQQQLVKELESNNPDTERQRVEKYGQEIVICSFCGTKNSLSFSRCLKCSMDLSKEHPVDNPYL